MKGQCMSLTHRRGRSALAVSSIATASVIAAMAAVPLSLVSPAAATAADSGTQNYIVQIASAPLASYTGGTKGLAATKPQAGKKVDTTGPAARAYEAHLKAARDAAMRSAGVTPSRATKTYDVAFSGFTASLTAARRQRLEKAPGVAQRLEGRGAHGRHRVDPEVPRPRGPDRRLAAAVRRQRPRRRGHDHRRHRLRHLAREPVVRRPARARAPTPRPSRRSGTAPARPGSRPTPAPVTCNNKLIGARYYDTGDDGRSPSSSARPRDYNGHGSHTASTAGGNHGVPATINGAPGRRRQRHGAAGPHRGLQGALGHARTGRASGSTSNLVKAIDDAVADGVDVINYSISGSTHLRRDAPTRSPSSARPTPASSSPPPPATAVTRSAPRASRTTRRGR